MGLLAVDTVLRHTPRYRSVPCRSSGCVWPSVAFLLPELFTALSLNGVFSYVSLSQQQTTRSIFGMCCCIQLRTDFSLFYRVRSTFKPSNRSKHQKQLVCDARPSAFQHWYRNTAKERYRHSVTYNLVAWFTKYLTTILRLSYDNANVTIDLRRTYNLSYILRRTQG